MRLPMWRSEGAKAGTSVNNDSDARSRGAASAQHRSDQAPWRSALDLVTTLAMLLVAGVILWNRFGTPNAASPQPVPIPTQPLSLEGLPLLGSTGAKAGLLIFSDFECPYCASFAGEIMPALKKRYVDTGLARVGFRHLPLRIHNRAKRAAESAECAAQQGQFWAMHDALFRAPVKLAEPDLTSDAAAIGLDATKFATCMSHPPSERVTRDVAVAQGLGLGRTPSFVIGRIERDALLHATSVFVGTREVDEFKKALDRVLKNR